MKLYEFGPTRSVRCRWLLQEMNVPFESVIANKLMRTPEYTRIHPGNKLPALEIDGKILIESVAICNYLADRFPEKNMIAKPGTWDRGLHDQWSFFAIAEMEAWLWSNAKHQFIYEASKRVPQIVEANSREFLASARIVDDALAGKEYLVGDRFSVTDIVVAYTLDWARRAGLLGDFTILNRYLDRLQARPHCALPKESPIPKA